MTYQVKKINIHTDEVKDYGYMCEEDMLLVTRGYKPMEDIPGYYTRRKSNWFYEVEEA